MAGIMNLAVKVAAKLCFINQEVQGAKCLRMARVKV